MRSSDAEAAITPREISPVGRQSLLAKFRLTGTTLAYRSGQTVFAQGDPARTVFYVQRGGVKLSVLSGHGKEAVVALLGAGSFLGEGCLAGQRVRMATATAIGISILIRIEQREMVHVLDEQHSFSAFFIRHILLRNLRVEADLVDQLFNSSEKRLARALLLIAHYGNQGKPKTDIPKISQETLAEMIGTTRARVSSFMNKFRKLGFIDYNGGLKVHSSLLSIVLHEGHPS
jgi:CRP/FNR family cyclic AMP-dependent transcriptional regulator